MLKAITLGFAGAIIAACLGEIFKMKSFSISMLGALIAVGLFFFTGDFFDV